jgi:hypothetical protein
MRRPAALILIASLLSIPFAIPVFGGQYEDVVAVNKRGDYITAYHLFKPLAEQGDAKAQHNRGFMYAKNNGVLQDYDEALKRAASVAGRIVSGIGG